MMIGDASVTRATTDLEVGVVLMVAKEFGIARSFVEPTGPELRARQKPWRALGNEFVREAAAA